MTSNLYSTKPALLREPRIAIVGAGMSGICLAAKLLELGVRTFSLYEKASTLGGTWRDNTYPGVACDVPSYEYQFSFDRTGKWSRAFAPGSEIHAYLENVARKRGITKHIQLDTEVTKIERKGSSWHLHSHDRYLGEADFVVTATGILHHPRYPEIAGMDSFSGAAFHSARWDHGVQFHGKRVGIVGTGSTGAQIISAMAPNVASLTVFQRSPQWVLPIPNPTISSVTWRALARVPGATTLGRQVALGVISLFIEAVTHEGWQRRLVNAGVKLNLRSVRSRELREKLRPSFKPMCRRLIMCSGYYRAMQRDNVQVVTEDIQCIERPGIRTADGRLHELDLLVLATGFDAHAFVRPIEILGPDGRSLEDEWLRGPRAYKTVALPGFPNLFTIMGPHSPVGNFSLIKIAENQSDYIIKWINEWRSGRLDTMEPKRESTDLFNDEIREAARGTIWASGCVSWYLGPDGLPEIWPKHPDEHQAMLSDINRAEFNLT